MAGLDPAIQGHMFGCLRYAACPARISAETCSGRNPSPKRRAGIRETYGTPVSNRSNSGGLTFDVAASVGAINVFCMMSCRRWVARVGKSRRA